MPPVNGGLAKKIEKPSYLSENMITLALLFTGVRQQESKPPYTPLSDARSALCLLEDKDNDEDLRNKVFNQISKIDLGISDFKFELENFMIIDEDNNTETKSERKILQCSHGHKKNKFDLSIFRESNGTQQSLFVLAKAYSALKTGGLMIFDEIEAGLHPFVVESIISLFVNKETNPHGVQLFFSTHLPLLLENRTKTQIFITERDENKLETEIYRLDDVDGVRNDENYFRKYIAGAYGGTPKIAWL